MKINLIKIEKSKINDNNLQELLRYFENSKTTKYKNNILILPINNNEFNRASQSFFEYSDDFKCNKDVNIYTMFNNNLQLFYQFINKYKSKKQNNTIILLLKNDMITILNAWYVDAYYKLYKKYTDFGDDIVYDNKILSTISFDDIIVDE